jgi:hypothetical protein
MLPIVLSYTSTTVFGQLVVIIVTKYFLIYFTILLC